MNEKNSLKRLISSIEKGRFSPHRYLSRKHYFGLEIKVDTIKLDGSFGLSVWYEKRYVTWLYHNKTTGDLNLGGRPYQEMLND